MTEKAFVAKAKKRLEAEVGGLWIAYPRTRFARAGVSDLLGCVRGRFVALEFKAPGSVYKATETQCNFLDTIRGEAGFGAVVDSETELTAVIAALSHIGV
jgi:hypothetical protein